MQYEIIIKNQTEGEESNPVVAGQTVGSSSASKPSGSSSNLSKVKTAFGVGLIAYNQIKPWINQIASYHISQVELRSGSAHQGQKAQFAYQIATDVVGIGTSIGAGFLAGGGPGAIVGAVAGVLHKVIGYSQSQKTLDTQKEIEDVSIRQNFIRAGAKGSRQ